MDHPVELVLTVVLEHQGLLAQPDPSVQPVRPEQEDLMGYQDRQGLQEGEERVGLVLPVLLALRDLPEQPDRLGL